jgi:ribonuclease VapC
MGSGRLLQWRVQSAGEQARGLIAARILSWKTSKGIVIEIALLIDASRDPIDSRRFDDLMREAQIVIEPVTEAQARVVREACRDFGKGSGHPCKAQFWGLLCLRISQGNW